MNRMWLPLIGLLTVALVAACGVPIDEQASELNESRIPERLRITTTTTTTTTQPPAPTPAQSSTSAPPTQTSSTLDVVESTRVDAFYVQPGVSLQVERVQLNLLPPVVIDDLIEQLMSPPLDVRANGLTTAVDDDLINDYDVARGTATINLNELTFDQMPDSQQRRALAQIVLTFTRFVPTEAGAIGQVVFTVDDEPIPVIIPNRGSSSPGEPLAYDDFASLVLEAGGPTTSSTTTTAPPSSDPLDDPG